MTSAAKALRARGTSGVVTATVRAIIAGAGNRVAVGLAGDTECEATLAVAGHYAPRAGDTVLLAAGEDGERYVIGVLVALREAKTAESAVVARDGTRVALEADGDDEVLRVRDGAGRLVLERRGADGRTVVYAPAGDLEFRAEEGGIELFARDAVRVRGGRGVEILGEHEVKIATAAAGERAGSSLEMGARGLNLATPALDARAVRADFALGEARVVARSVSTAVETAKHVVGVVETQATRIVERAKNVYRDVAELAQTRAGRVRMVAQTTFHLMGKRTLLKAEEDMKLKGDKIHLG